MIIIRSSTHYYCYNIIYLVRTRLDHETSDSHDGHNVFCFFVTVKVYIVVKVEEHNR
jgi:hypothetical protein